MRMTARVLVKGVTVKTGTRKDGSKTEYHNVGLYGLEGYAKDIRAGIDIRQGLGVSQKAKELLLKPAIAVLEYSEWEGKSRFNLVDIEGV